MFGTESIAAILQAHTALPKMAKIYETTAVGGYLVETLGAFLWPCVLMA